MLVEIKKEGTMAENKPQILAFLPGLDKKFAVQELCEKLEIEYNDIAISEINFPIYALAGLEGVSGTSDKKEKAPIFYNMPEIIIFCGLEDKKLDDFLAGFKLAGIQPVALKAVVTPTNVKWTPYQLSLELAKEAKRMR